MRCCENTLSFTMVGVIPKGHVGVFSGLNGFFDCFKVSKVQGLPILPYLRCPLFGIFGPENTRVPALVCSAFFHVTQVVFLSNVSKVSYPVVSRISVDVVNVFRWPFPIMQRPDNSVSRKPPAINAPHKVSVSIFIAKRFSTRKLRVEYCSFPFTWVNGWRLFFVKKLAAIRAKRDILLKKINFWKVFSHRSVALSLLLRPNDTGILVWEKA